MTEHLHIELHITVKDVLNPSILYIELQADVGIVLLSSGAACPGGDAKVAEFQEH